MNTANIFAIKMSTEAENIHSVFVGKDTKIFFEFWEIAEFKIF
jgi:hypothetical protein